MPYYGFESGAGFILSDLMLNPDAIVMFGFRFKTRSIRTDPVIGSTTALRKSDLFASTHETA